MLIRDIRQSLGGLMIEYVWNKDLLRIIDAGTEGRRTVGGLVNRITCAVDVHADSSNSDVLDLKSLRVHDLFANVSNSTLLAHQRSGRCGNV